MSLNFAINSAKTGLNATSRQAEVTANNVANANTEGYDRREVELNSVAIDGRGAGVRVTSVERATAAGITADRRRSDADLGEQTALAEGASRLADLVGGPDTVTSLFAKFEAMEASIRELSDTPESTLAQNGVLNAAIDLADQFNEVGDQLLRLRQDTDAEIARQIDIVNDTLVDIDELNEQISKSANLGQNTSEFEAQRDHLIDQITEIVPIEILPQNDGQVFLATTTGAMLLSSQAAEFEFTAAGTITADMDYRGGAPGSLSGLTLNGADITPDDTGVQTIASGSLRGLFEVRDAMTLEFQTQIDALAEDLISRFDAAEPTGTIPAGSAGLFTDGQAASSGTAGLASRLEVNDLVIPPTGSLDGLSQGVYVAGTPVAGDNAHEINLLEAMTTVQAGPAGLGVSGLHSAADLAAELGSQVSTDALMQEERAAVRASQTAALDQAESAATGVDIDTELQNLTLIQTAYAANARVLQVANQMLQTLMEI